MEGANNYMEKNALDECLGKRVKLILENGYYYDCHILSVGEDYTKIRDKNETTTFISLKEIKILELKE